MTRALYGDFISLQTAGIILGILLIGGHLFALLKPAFCQNFLKRFPRHKEIGIGLMAVNFLWTYWLVQNADLGEFYTWKKALTIIVPAGFFLVIFFVDEFLAARALGMFALLFACPLLEVAFLKLPVSRLLIPIICYVWIVLGLFWVGMPYTLRDQISWVSKSSTRWNGLAAGGVVYGVAVLICAFAYWGGEI